MKKDQTAENDRKNFSKSDNENRDRQGVDKAPGEEAGKGEKPKAKDLKGKKTDADPSQESDRPTE
jgi:hypothetical protein